MSDDAPHRGTDVRAEEPATTPEVRTVGPSAAALRATAPEAVGSAPDPSEHAGGSPIAIGSDREAIGVLVASTDPERCALTGQVAEELGFRVSFCGAPSDVVEHTRRLAPKIVIVDLDIGAEGAAGIVRSLRRPTTAGRVFVMVMASDDNPGRLVRLASVRADDFLIGELSREKIGFRLTVAERRVREGPDHLALRIPRGGEGDGEPTLLEAVDGWWDWDVRSGGVVYSARWQDMVGCCGPDTSGSPEEWLARVHPDDVEALKARIDEFVAGTIQHLEHGHRLRFEDGSYHWTLTRGFAVRGGDGVAERVIGLQTDVSAQMRAEERLQYDALHDPLTGLPNRTLFIDRLDHAFSRVRRSTERSFAVLFLDVDRFKNLNDGLGHLTGDRLLCAIASRLEQVLRPNDTVARFGGDEFVVLVEDMSDVHAITGVARRIEQEFRQPFDLDGMEVFATVSMGISVWSERYERPDELLRDADTAMYRAKALGRNRFVVFDEDMHKQAVAALSLENDLRRALDRQQFEVYYQPIVALDTGMITGFEALIRWHHPERGFVSPGDFIPLAEETGMIIQIDRWVLEEACRQLRVWQTEFRPRHPLSVSVNVSGLQFMQPDLITQIDHSLRKNGLYGRSLNIEITESVIMEDAGHATAMLEQLKSLDIGLSIDDFGTGYSSLSYLRRFDIDALKIDHSFVSRMLRSGESLEIVRTIISLAGNLGKATVVEGVETGTQLEMIRTMGADRVQGFFVSRPVCAGDAHKLLEIAAGSEDFLSEIARIRADEAAVARGSRPHGAPS